MDDPREPGRAPPVPEPAKGCSIDEVRSIADQLLGVERTAGGLSEAADALASGTLAKSPATSIAWLVANAALGREESRGGHHRRDFPSTRDEWRIRQAVDRDGWTSIPVSDRADVNPSRTDGPRSRPGPAG
jgi:aspartate oxidase